MIPEIVVESDQGEMKSYHLQIMSKNNIIGI